MIKRFSPAAIGRWSTRRPALAIAAWLMFVVAAVLALSLTGSKRLENGAVGESARGYALMDAHQLSVPQHEYAYLHSSTLTAPAPAFRAAISQVSARMQGALGGPAHVTVARDRHAALVTGTPTGPFATAAVEASVAAVATAHPGVSAIVADPTSGTGNDLHRAEQLSIPVTLVVLLISFGALVAALAPVMLAATAVIAAFGLLGPISQVFPLDDSVQTVVLLIGMAVGVDYALFYVVRSREERLRGASTREALERTSRTSGRSVLIAGSTVAIAMAGQFVVGSDIFNGIAAGTIVVVACAVAGSVTVLPALLQILGPRVDRGRIPFLPQLATAGGSRFWAGLVDRVLRRPVLAACLSGGLLVALAVPALGLEVAKPSSDALASASQSELAAQITHDFPSTSSPAVVVAVWPSGERFAMREAVDRLEALAASRGVAHPPFAIGLGSDGSSLALGLPLTGFGDNATSRAAIRELRAVLVPRTLGQVTGVRTAVTGDTAQDIDFTNQMRHGVPYVFALALALEELRELTQGIHPTLLVERGLPVALEELCRRAGLPAHLDVDLDVRLPDQVETAAYYFASEALSNAVKHSHGSEVRVEVAYARTTLTVQIADDGIGGAAIGGVGDSAGSGSGLRGLADRVEALGGQFTISSPPGRGTRLRAQIPCA